MRNQRFYLYSVGTILTALISAIAIYTHSYIAAAVLGFTSLGFTKLSSREANESGRTDRMKLTVSIHKNLSEIVILGALVASTQVPKLLAVAFLVLMTFEKAFLKDMNNSVMRKLNLRIGPAARIFLASNVLLAASFNSFAVYWGAWLLTLVAAYDVAYLVYSGFSEV